MLCGLTIQNVAIIEELQVQFHQGLNVLTGETGAGKSIIIDAVNLVLGERADRDLIRYGASQAMVEALFDISSSAEVKALLAEMGFNTEDNVLVVIRELTDNGRAVCRMNGRTATLSQLREVTARLVDIHGQHQHQSLLDPKNHRAVLDKMGDESFAAALEKTMRIAQAYNEKQKTSAQIFTGNEQERQRRLDMLEFQFKEIEDAELASDEEEVLLAQRNRLLNMERIQRALGTAYGALYEGGEEGQSALSLMAMATKALQDLAGFGSEYEGLVGKLEEARYLTDDIAAEIGNMLDADGQEEANIEIVENRLQLVRQLKRKYGADIEEILAFGMRAKDERDELLSAEERLMEIERELAQLMDQWRSAAADLSAERRKLAMKLEDRVARELQDLGMPKAQWKIDLERKENIIAPVGEGWDEVQFLFSPNPGEPAKPLDKVVSGGELSRIMLALKQIFAANDGIACLIFDEIDNGISGNMARIVGQKMSEIGKTRQVICVTHSAAIAAMGNTHYFISKVVENERTHTQVQELYEEERVLEINRLVGGTPDDPVSMQHAKHMLGWG